MADADALPADSSDPHVTADRHVKEIIEDFKHGLITRRDAERVRDQASKAVRDIDSYRGFNRA